MVSVIIITEYSWSELLREQIIKLETTFCASTLHIHTTLGHTGVTLYNVYMQFI